MISALETAGLTLLVSRTILWTYGLFVPDSEEN
jgi:hypothetical protein